MGKVESFHKLLAEKSFFISNLQKTPWAGSYAKSSSIEKKHATRPSGNYTLSTYPEKPGYLVRVKPEYFGNHS
jgi:hypothetical protein